MVKIRPCKKRHRKNRRCKNRHSRKSSPYYENRPLIDKYRPFIDNKSVGEPREII